MLVEQCYTITFDLITIIHWEIALKWIQFKIQIALFLIRFPLAQKQKYLYLTYEALNEQDGLGSQLQKIMGVYSVAQYANISYVHTPIQQVMWHPLDLQASELSSEQLLAKYNSVFRFPSAELVQFDNEYINHEISVLKFIRIMYTAVFRRRLTLISITRPYAIVDLDPNMYKVVKSALSSWPTRDSQVEKTIALHIRQGVPSRTLPMKYFEDLLHDIVLEFGYGDNLAITILTDLPSAPRNYEVEESQKALWEAGGFLSTDRNLPVPESQSFIEFTSLYKNVTVKFGGDVLDALYAMESADHFLMSKSSLSFVGAVLNQKGSIYFPSDFYHPPMQDWKLIPR